MKVLLVDPCPATLVGVRTLLESCSDMEVVGEAQSAEEVVDKARYLCPDLVVLDSELDETTDALGICRELKTLPLPPRVLLYAAHSSQRGMVAASLAGADSYLYKGLDGNRLTEAASETCSGNRVLLPGPVEDEGDDLEAITEGAQELTNRESEILALLVGRRTNPEIASELCVSLDTVKTHVKRIFLKLRVRDRRELSG